MRINIKVWNSNVVIIDETGDQYFSHRPYSKEGRADAVTVAMLMADICSDAGDEVVVDYLN